MTRVSDSMTSLSIRLSYWLNLIFFAFCLIACNTEHSRDILLDWHNGKPVSVSIPFNLIQDSEEDFIPHGLKVTLQHSLDPLLGEIHISGNHARFTPALPFQRGRNYSVYYHEKLLGEFNVPASSRQPATTLQTIHPEADTIPDNALKFYLSFSAPMKEGEGLKYIKLLNAKNEPLTDIFLDLQSELWNEDRTVLTIWLDPGRIKRELVPNKTLGNPLVNGLKYSLVVQAGWKDATGAPMSEEFRKSFVVTARDSIGPDPESWLLSAPAKHTAPLQVMFNESLDHYLLQETMTVINDAKVGLRGSFSSSDKDSRLSFQPEKPWIPGRYFLRVAGMLEDLAGNNINRPFDRDLASTPLKESREFVEIPFNVEFLP
jgi:hypothetical protein